MDWAGSLESRPPGSSSLARRRRGLDGRELPLGMLPVSPRFHAHRREETGMIARILIGDVLERLRKLPDESIDSVVTDPPYELGFMGKAWDSSGIAYDVTMWSETLRVLKPGGHLLAFGGSRTYHRMACAIEDAGFEIRDQIMWLYGSGFPKSLDVSKAIDKQRKGNDRLR